MFKRTIPVLITAIVGLLMVLDSYLRVPVIHSSATELRAWVPIITSFAVITGSLNLIGVHWRTVSRKTAGRHYSVIFLVFLVATVVVGLSQGTTAPLYDFCITRCLYPVHLQWQA